jgi:hypothetical protein
MQYEQTLEQKPATPDKRNCSEARLLIPIIISNQSFILLLSKLIPQEQIDTDALELELLAYPALHHIFLCLPKNTVRV